MRTAKSFKIDNIPKFKAQLLEWSKKFNEIVWLDSNSYNQNYGQYDAILAVDALTVLSINSTSAFEELKRYQNEINDWIFGYLNYDLKNSIEQLSSSNFDGLDFPELHMFQPKRMIFLEADTVVFKYHETVKNLINPDFKIISETEREEKILMEESLKASKSIDERFLKAYNRIRGASKNGLAVVPVERGASGGSFIKIPPQVQLDIAARKKIIVDEHSGRILVDALLADEQSTKMNRKINKVLSAK